MTYDENIYKQIKDEFMAKHTCERKVYTSPLVDNKYHKDYCYSDGANWSEITELVEEVVVVVVHSIRTKVTVKLWKTEYFSTDDSKSRYYYEKA